MFATSVGQDSYIHTRESRDKKSTQGTETVALFNLERNTSAEELVDDAATVVEVVYERSLVKCFWLEAREGDNGVLLAKALFYTKTWSSGWPAARVWAAVGVPARQMSLARRIRIVGPKVR